MQGATGPQGTQGFQGAQGAQGAQGTFTADSAYFYTTTKATRAANSLVPMTMTGPTVGSGVTLNAGSVSLASAGTYQVSYTFSQAANSLLATQLISAYLVLNGSEVAGSRTIMSNGNVVAEDGLVSLTLLVTAPAGSTLGLYTAAAGSNSSGLPNGVVGSLSITRLT